MFFFFKQKTAYEMRISDWSSDVCSSDLCSGPSKRWKIIRSMKIPTSTRTVTLKSSAILRQRTPSPGKWRCCSTSSKLGACESSLPARLYRSEEHTSELQSLMRISYAVFCLKKKKTY